MIERVLLSGLFVRLTLAPLAGMMMRGPDPNLQRRARSSEMGWPGGILEGGDWGKPKGMHWRTYERLCREHDALSDLALVGIMDHLNRLAGRF